MDKIISSFLVKDTLNPEIWDNYDNVEESKMKTEIRDGLLDIANEFIDSLGLIFLFKILL